MCLSSRLRLALIHSFNKAAREEKKNTDKESEAATCRGNVEEGDQCVTGQKKVFCFLQSSSIIYQTSSAMS